MLYILLLAAGSSERFGKKSKIFADLAGKPVFLHSLEKFLKLKEEKKIILVVNRKEYRMWNMEYGMFLKENSIELVIGGVTRQTSVFKGFEYVSNQWLVVSSQYLIIHNCANPLVTEKEILDCMKMAKKCGVAGVGQKIDGLFAMLDEEPLDEKCIALVHRRARQMATPVLPFLRSTVHFFRTAD